MINSFRKQFNLHFSGSKYATLLDWIEAQHAVRPPFKVCESPVFIDLAFKKKLVDACNQIVEVIMDSTFMDRSGPALHPSYNVPNENSRPHFITLDFGVCSDEQGELVPQLIEAQGFPSLCFYQNVLGKGYREVYEIPAHLDYFFGGHSEQTYLKKLKRIIVGNADPKNVVLLEIDPYNQPTAIDFVVARDLLGIKILCISDLKRSGKSAYYLDENGQKVEIQRIFNRVIFDELYKRPDIHPGFDLRDPIDVEWVGHPNWFFRISKHTLSFLKNPYVPESTILSEMETVPANLQDYVLKPLFSFSGAGVKINVQKQDLLEIEDRSNYMLQKKVSYTPIIETLDVKAKCEVRMLLVWEDGVDKPEIISNLVRLSKGDMIGVRYNKGKDWVGGSIGFFE